VHGRNAIVPEGKGWTVAATRIGANAPPPSNAAAVAGDFK